MYKAKLSEEDKWNIHSEGYHSSKYAGSPPDRKDDKKYHEQKYGPGGKDPSSDYMRKEEQKEKDEKKATDAFDLEEEKKEKEAIDEKEIPFKAARMVFEEGREEARNAPKKKDAKTIEDAIKKAVEDEKKVIMMDS
ncbi:hypothetical protein HYT53_01450 [Candidatus Woesearchaeota archaeon]|nr:hypothetical protein [Candidatus Woesearchaeota archaeon]